MMQSELLVGRVGFQAHLLREVLWRAGVRMVVDNTARAGAAPQESLLPSGISGNGNATTATHTIPMPLQGVLVFSIRAGQEQLVSRSSIRRDPDQREPRLPSQQLETPGRCPG